MNARVIYLQSGFWKQLRADTSIAGIRCLMNVYDAMLESELRTDISDDDFDHDSYLVFLWKRHVSGQSHVELYENITIDKPDDNAEDLSAIYLTDVDNNTCNNLGNQYGIVAISSGDIAKKDSLFKGDGFMLKKNRMQYLDRYMLFHHQIHHPCNAMILIDPYILSKKENIQNNLFSLLDATLPNRKLQIRFQIAIFSMIGDRNTDVANIEDWYNKVKDIVTALRKGLNFDLTIYAIGSSEEFHSRMILTNNVFFNAPDGFDVFREDNTSNKNAKFDIVLPRLMGDNRQDMSNYLRWIKIAKIRSERQSESQFYGNRENRLYELVR